MSAVTPVTPLPNAAAYLRSRYPLHSNGAAVLTCFLCSAGVYELSAPGRASVEPGELAGAATSVLLFLQLRLADDLADLAHDLPADTAAADRQAARRWFVGAIILTCLAVVALNIAWPKAAAAAMASMTLAVLTPLVLKRVLRENRLLLAPCYEAAPLLVFIYGYVLWSEATGRHSPAPVVAGMVLTLWAGYEFWKFSRKVGQDAYQPYGFGPSALRVTLLLLLAASAAGDLLIAVGAGLSPFFFAYSCLVPAGYAVWMALRWPRSGAEGHAGWQGPSFVASLLVALLVEAGLAALELR